MKTEADRLMLPQAREHQMPAEAEKAREESPLRPGRSKASEVYKLKRQKFMDFFNPQGLWSFVIAALGNEYRCWCRGQGCCGTNA